MRSLAEYIIPFHSPNKPSIRIPNCVYTFQPVILLCLTQMDILFSEPSTLVRPNESPEARNMMNLTPNASRQRMVCWFVRSVTSEIHHQELLVSRWLEVGAL